MVQLDLLFSNCETSIIQLKNRSKFGLSHYPILDHQDWLAANTIRDPSPDRWEDKPHDGRGRHEQSHHTLPGTKFNDVEGQDGDDHSKSHHDHDHGKEENC